MYVLLQACNYPQFWYNPIGLFHKHSVLRSDPSLSGVSFEDS